MQQSECQELIHHILKNVTIYYDRMIDAMEYGFAYAEDKTLLAEQNMINYDVP